MKKIKLYFVCPDMKTPSGGIKQIYKQVDILNNNGFNACVLHHKKGFRCDWFENNTKIEYSRSIFMAIRHQLKAYSEYTKNYKKTVYRIFNKQKLENNSILIFPEIYGPYINEIEPTIPKVIFNQNCYYTFIRDSYIPNTSYSPYINSNTIHSIVVSEDSKKHLEYVFPSIPISRIINGIDSAKFSLGLNKKKQIAFMPRKLKNDIIQLINIVRIRNKIKGWNFVIIDNMSEAEVATVMKESHIFLSFNQTEGFGLPPAEAMACGCIVIGYTGGGANEYFKTEFSYPIADGDIIRFCSEIENVVELFSTQPDQIAQKQRNASEFILSNYSLEKEKETILYTWNKILSNTN